MNSDIFNENNTDTLGLSEPPGIETVTVWKAGTSGDHYCNGVCLAEYKGKLYCQWQSSTTDGDSADTHVMYAVSGDKGKTWSTPQVLAQNIGNGYCTSGGWLATPDKPVAYINFWDNSLRACLVSFYVRIFEQNFVDYKEKIRRHTVVWQGFLTQ